MRIAAWLVLWPLMASAVGYTHAAEGIAKGYTTTDLVFSGRTFTAYHPETFELEVLTTDLQKPRIIHFHDDQLFIGSRSGNIYRLDPPYRSVTSIAKLDNYPHSIVIHDGFLYVARKNGIYRTPYSKNSSWIEADKFALIAKLPSGKGHSSRTIKIGPDGRLYVSLGISGNCSDQYLDNSYPFKSRRGGVFVIDESGQAPALVPFASGLRNPIGFDWHPDSGELYASNNGPDHLGFDQPPEYFTRLQPDSFHGMPWYQYDGKSFVRDDCQDSTPPRPAGEIPIPAALLPARAAPMDVVFVTGAARAAEYSGDAIIALHGSWAAPLDDSGKEILAQRRPPKLVLVKFKNGRPGEILDLITGFQSPNSGSRWARPVGVGVGPDGEIYFTSDAGAQGLFRLKKLADPG